MSKRFGRNQKRKLLAEKSCRYGLTTKTVAFFFFNEYFYKLVVINDPELARNLKLIKE